MNEPSRHLPLAGKGEGSPHLQQDRFDKIVGASPVALDERSQEIQPLPSCGLGVRPEGLPGCGNGAVHITDITRCEGCEDCLGGRVDEVDKPRGLR